MRIEREDSVGLVIDIQERLLPHMQQNDELIRNTRILLEGFKVLGIPVLITEQYRKGLGETNPLIAEGLVEFNPLEKKTFSCCDDRDFEKALEQMDRRKVIISGIETHVCVLQTVVDLLEKGYLPVVVEDCISSRKASDKETAIHRMRQEGAIISTYESILFELARVSGTEEFKAISRLVK